MGFRFLKLYWTDVTISQVVDMPIGMIRTEYPSNSALGVGLRTGRWYTQHPEQCNLHCGIRIRSIDPCPSHDPLLMHIFINCQKHLWYVTSIALNFTLTHRYHIPPQHMQRLSTVSYYIDTYKATHLKDVCCWNTENLDYARNMIERLKNSHSITPHLRKSVFKILQITL